MEGSENIRKHEEENAGAGESGNCISTRLIPKEICKHVWLAFKYLEAGSIESLTTNDNIWQLAQHRKGFTWGLEL